MNVTVSPGTLHGAVPAIPSKSQAHRALIAAALSDAPSRIFCGALSDDILATVRCLRALGADVEIRDGEIGVAPVYTVPETAELPCGESGSTLRFLLPVAAALGTDAVFRMEGRLPDRPVGPITDLLAAKGAEISRPEKNLLRVRGPIRGGDYPILGNISSQFVTGLLFALPLLPAPGRVLVKGRLESGDYVNMTVEMMNRCGFSVQRKENVFTAPRGRGHLPEAGIAVEGDWSCGAFWLCAGALLPGGLAVAGLDPKSAQGDRAVLDRLREFGAEVRVRGTEIFVRRSALRGISLDASAIPDLIPCLAPVAAAAEGVTRITGAGRLRLKESDRLGAIADVLRSLGVRVETTEDTMTIRGGGVLRGGKVSSAGDHRIAMTAALAALAAGQAVTVQGAECVNKSYPALWEDWEKLGGALRREFGNE